MLETGVQSLDQEDLLEKEMANHSNILASEIPRTEDPGRLESIGSQRSDTTLVTKHINTQRHERGVCVCVCVC